MSHQPVSLLSNGRTPPPADRHSADTIVLQGTIWQMCPFLQRFWYFPDLQPFSLGYKLLQQAKPAECLLVLHRLSPSLVNPMAHSL